MSNALTVPSYIAARIANRKGQEKSPITAAILSDSLYNYPKISIRAGRYRLVEDGVETPVGVTLDVIIVGANPRVSKVFYNKPYDGNADGIRPDCFSNDGIRPDPSVLSPVHANCADCPNNVLGSKITPSGAKSKLCNDQRHMAVVPAADPTKVYGLTVPVSAMKALREYFKDLNNYGINPEEVITELGFDDNASYPKMTFKLKGFVPEKYLEQIEAITQSEEVKVATRVITAATSAPSLPVAEQMALPLEEKAETKPVKVAKATKAAAEKVPVNASIAELEDKLDSLFS